MVREPKCKYFNECGGCTGQHVEYELQKENKRRLLSHSIKVPIEEVKVFSGEEYNYRNRMDLIFHEKGIGLREKGKWWKIVDIEYCAIANKKINELIKEVREYFVDCDYFHIKEQKGTFKYAVIRAPQEDSSISFVLNEDSTKLAEAIEKVKGFSERTSAKKIIITKVPAKTDMSISSDFFVVKGEDMLNEKYLDKEFKYSVQGFFQNNYEMAEAMIKYVKELLSKYDTKTSGLLDLYGGVGSFGICNSELFNELIIVENDVNCIDSAKKNLEKNNIKNARAYAMDAMRLSKISLPEKLFIITDPPRSGMHQKAIRTINDLEPEVIIYVSCNVRQLGKELFRFKNYEIKSSAMFDLFPQTTHCEGVVELIKKKTPE